MVVDRYQTVNLVPVWFAMPLLVSLHDVRATPARFSPLLIQSHILFLIASADKMLGAKLRARLAGIEHQMRALEAQMNLLRVEHQNVSKDLEAIVYPVLTLPTEITSEIFIRYVDDHPQHTPHRLMPACRQWREVAISTCRLWTRLHGSGTPFPCIPSILVI